MRITGTKCQLVLDANENEMLVLVLENPAMFADVVQTIYEQCMGREGEFVLSEEGQILQIAKHAAIVLDYYSLDLNDRCVQNRLYSQMREIGTEFNMEKQTLISQSAMLLEKVIAHLPFEHVKYDLDVEWNELLKMHHVRVEEDYNTLLEKLIAYLRVCSELMGLRLIVFVNLKSYLTSEELSKLYQMANYFKLQLLLIEAREYVALEEEKKYIVDKDWCLIGPN